MPGIHIPQNTGTLRRYGELAGRLEADGYDRIWIGEIDDVDAVTAAVLATTGTTQARIGVFVNVFTRAPSTLAMTASSLARLAPGRVQIVLGVGSPLFAERWNGIPYTRLADRLRDTLRFLRLALSGERIREPFPTIPGRGFALASPPEVPPELLVAATGPRALALAAEEADGVALNWVGVGDLGRVEPLPSDPARITLVVPICPTDDPAEADRTMRPIVTTYLTVPGYASQQRRFGRSDALAPMWAAADAGDRDGARAALPASVIADLVVTGTPAECRRRLEAIERETGTSVVTIVFPPAGRRFSEVVLPDR